MNGHIKKTTTIGIVLLLMVVIGEASFFLGLKKQKNIIVPSCSPQKECTVEDLAIVREEKTISYFLNYMTSYLKDKKNTYKKPSFVLEHEGRIQGLAIKDKKVSFKVTDEEGGDVPFSYSDYPYSRLQVYLVESTIIKKMGIEALQNGERVLVKNIRKLTPDQINKMDIAIEIYILEKNSDEK